MKSGITVLLPLNRLISYIAESEQKVEADLNDNFSFGFMGCGKSTVDAF